MNGVELDRLFRECAARVTRDTILSEVRVLTDAGFPALAAFKMMSDIVLAKERGDAD